MSDLYKELKKLGWSDELINNFIINDQKTALIFSPDVELEIIDNLEHVGNMTITSTGYVIGKTT